MATRFIKLAGVAVAASLSTSAQAQVGSGWSSTTMSHTTQTAGCGTISGNTFQLTCSTASGVQRAEWRYASFTSGQRQFQGTLKVNSMGGDRISVHQVYLEGVNPRLQMGYKKPGTLYNIQGQATLGSLAIGSTVRINSTIVRSTGVIGAYVGGSLRQTIDAENNGTWYFKLGAYRSDSGEGPVSTTWTNISFYTKP
jgi:hypothetical protein